ncbi:MAG: class II aldolase/adducin family protein [Pseudomonadota bacterium]
MNTRPELLTAEFRALSARLGRDPLQVQGPGGNTSIKGDGVMWIKASGTELAQAEEQEIFVAVDRDAAAAEAHGAGGGSCKETVLDPALGLRPSIETTFHAALDWPVVVHTHSVATLTHAISPEGCAAAREKLHGLPYSIVPYAKPGLPLTREILARNTSGTEVFILQNHGVICGGPTVEAVAERLAQVEDLLKMPAQVTPWAPPADTAPDGFAWAGASWIAQNNRASALALSGSYYPDHVVFLGPALPQKDHGGQPPAVLIPGKGVALRQGATSSQAAMVQCLSDMLARLPADWTADPIGNAAEAELLNWDAEKYRQALAARQ